METGNMSQWLGDGGGSEAHSGNYSSTVSSEQAHSGRYSIKSVIDTRFGVSGTRYFRQKESREYGTNNGLYFSAWYFIPAPAGITAAPGNSWWMPFGIKVKEIQNGQEQSNNLLMIEVHPTSDPNNMVFQFKYRKPMDPPLQFTVYYQNGTPKRVPIGRWFRLETYITSSLTNGQYIVWLDGQEMFRLNNIVTRPSAYPGYSMGTPDIEIANYGSAMNPSPLTVYIDDVIISTSRVP